jgi:hypothetical protein
MQIGIALVRLRGTRVQLRIEAGRMKLAKLTLSDLRSVVWRYLAAVQRSGCEARPLQREKDVPQGNSGAKALICGSIYGPTKVVP